MTKESKLIAEAFQLHDYLFKLCRDIKTSDSEYLRLRPVRDIALSRYARRLNTLKG